MSHVRRDPELGEQVGKPAPSKGCLESHLDRLRAELVEQLLQFPRSRSDLPVEDQLAVVVDRCHLALLAVKVHSDVNHVQGLLPVGCMIAGEITLDPEPWERRPAPSSHHLGCQRQRRGTLNPKVQGSTPCASSTKLCKSLIGDKRPSAEALFS